MSTEDKPNKNETKTYQDKSGKFKKGNPGGGRPKGSISIKDKIRQHLKDNPEKLEELVAYYMENEQPIMRKLLWEMLDGKPKETKDLEINTKPILVKFIDGRTEDNRNTD